VSELPIVSDPYEGDGAGLPRLDSAFRDELLARGYSATLLDVGLASQIQDMLEQGASDPEIVAALAGRLNFDAWQRLDRRRLENHVALCRGAVAAPTFAVAVPDATPDNVRAERARRLAAGEPYGYGALAKVFVLSKTTIRRRLGK
jgi:hypothetical protein